MSLKNVAVFGVNGQLGQSITKALLRCKKQTFNVLAVIPPGSQEPPVPKSNQYKCEIIDVLKASRDELKNSLKGVNAVVSALNGKALDFQAIIQDAAADAGVKRFYPSEYGFHQTYHKPGDDWGYIHPMWDWKAKTIEAALDHPAIDSGKMSYTLIGCGDFYNQGREAVWCPWTQHDPPNGTYTFHVIGPAGAEKAKADFTHIDDFANFLVATLCEPEKSENAHLNFVSDTISHEEIAGLLEKYSAMKVKFEKYSEEDMHRIVAKPDSAPDELKQSAFPVDFWFLVKGSQGAGKFRRPKGEISNHLFPDVKVTTFDDYLKLHQAENEWKELHGPATRETAEHPM